MNCPTGFPMRSFSLERLIPFPTLPGPIRTGMGCRHPCRGHSLRSRPGCWHGRGTTIPRTDGQATTNGHADRGVPHWCFRAVVSFCGSSHPTGFGDYWPRLRHHHFSSLSTNRERNGIQKMMKSLFAAIARFISGANANWVGCVPDVRQRIYFANHTSNLDALVIWASFPPALRALTRPVAARDYWIKGKFRPYLAQSNF